MNYYPPTLSLASIIREFPEMELVDAAEQQRLQDIEDRKKRGKGAPKKAKSKGPSLRSRFPMIPLLNFSSALFAFQPTADVLRGNDRQKGGINFCGILFEDLLSNLECINFDAMSSHLALDHCLVPATATDPRKTRTSFLSLSQSIVIPLPRKCPPSPPYPLPPETPPQTTTFIPQRALS